MQVNTSTYSSNAAATASASSASTTAGSTLSETQFLQLLTEQLENQDPLQPEDDTQFLSQMAQFTALQETNTLNQQVQNLTAGSYIGSTVTVNPGTSSSAVTGKVTGVDTSGTTPQLVINGNEYPLSELQMVDPVVASASTASSTSSASSAASTPTASSTPVATAIKAVTSLLKSNANN
ncbi:MAG: flagellar hook capping FlgD N-terminal domain-containing protein [Opitutaceae bacterium]